MRDEFEKELQDILIGFDRQPEAGAWDEIKWRIQGRVFSFLSPSVFLWGTVAILLGGWMWWQLGPSTPLEQKNKPVPIENDLFRVHTVYSMDKKGEWQLSSIDTVILDEALYAVFKTGRSLFKRNCGVCHAVDMITRASGPALGGITQLRSREWLYAFTRNSQAMIAAGDPIALEVWNKWKPAVMTPFLSLTDEELKAIYAFIDIKTPGDFVPE